VMFSPDGKKLISGGRDLSIRLWEVETGKEVMKFDGHSDCVNFLLFVWERGRER